MTAMKSQMGKVGNKPKDTTVQNWCGLQLVGQGGEEFKSCLQNCYSYVLWSTQTVKHRQN